MIVRSDFLDRTLGHFYRQQSGGKWVLKEKAALLQTPQASLGQLRVCLGWHSGGKEKALGPPVCSEGRWPHRRCSGAVQGPTAAGACSTSLSCCTAGVLECGPQGPIGALLPVLLWHVPCAFAFQARLHARCREAGLLFVCRARACGSEPGHAAQARGVCAAGPQLKGRDGMSACPCCGTGASSWPARAVLLWVGCILRPV